jgi:hypothetical protein
MHILQMSYGTVFGPSMLDAPVTRCAPRQAGEFAAALSRCAAVQPVGASESNSLGVGEVLQVSAIFHALVGMVAVERRFRGSI